MAVNLGSFGRFEPDLSSPMLFRRCANCPTTPPPCPSCPQGQVCSLISQGCDTCPVVMCQTIGSGPSNSNSKSSGSAAGPIAGGVIGGIAFVCLVTFLFWRFCIRKRLAARRRQLYEDWQNAAALDEKDADGFETQRDARASMHSVRSIASTVLTRASNVIQIAYIPGVTNRSVDSTPDLVPPVPPIPAASPYHSSSSTPVQQDEHYFLPSNLRDSTYSDYNLDRGSYARSSMAPSFGRGSVPSTAYRGSAIVHTEPAQTAVRYKANPVAVKSAGKNSPLDSSRANTPPVPIMDRARYAAAREQTIQSNTTSPIVARLGVPKAVTVTKSSSSNGNARAAASKPPEAAEAAQAKGTPERKPSVAESTRHNGDSSTFDDASSSEEESTADRSLMGHEKLPQFVKSSPKAGQPFRSPSSAPDLHHASTAAASSSTPPDSHSAKFVSRDRRQRHQRSGSLNQIIEEAARRASREPRHGGLGSVGSVVGNYKRELRGSKEGPFSDAHAAGTP